MGDYYDCHQNFNSKQLQNKKNVQLFYFFFTTNDKIKKNKYYINKVFSHNTMVH